MQTKVYKCRLLSVSNNIKIYKDLSKRKNIEQAETVEVETIFVQQTSNPSYLKEVISGKLIPVFRIQKITGSGEEIIYKYPPAWPCYIKYIEELENEEYRGNTLEEANYEELKAYYDKYRGEETTEIMDKHLEEIFSQGESFYQEALKKQEMSEQGLIKKLIKSRKK